MAKEWPWMVQGPGYISSRLIWFSLVSLKQQMVARHFIDAYCLLNISIHIASTSFTDTWTRKPLVLHWLSTVKNVSNVTAEKPLIVFKTSNRSAALFLLCSFLQWANSKSLQPIILEKFRPGNILINQCWTLSNISSRSSKVINLGANGKHVQPCNFLLVINSNFGCIPYHFQDIDV